MAQNPNRALNCFRKAGRDGTILKIFIGCSSTVVSFSLAVRGCIFGPVVEWKKPASLKKAYISR